MIKYIRYIYREWRIGNEYRLYDIGFRDHPKAKDINFNRYEAIAYVTLELVRNGVLECDRYVEVSKDGKHMQFTARKKHFKYLLTLTEKVQ